MRWSRISCTISIFIKTTEKKEPCHPHRKVLNSKFSCCDAIAIVNGKNAFWPRFKIQKFARKFSHKMPFLVIEHEITHFDFENKTAHSYRILSLANQVTILHSFAVSVWLCVIAQCVCVVRDFTCL